MDVYVCVYLQKMQAHMRGYLTRKQMREFVASVTIQAHFRGWQARRKYGPSLQHAINTRNSKFSQDENQIHPQGRRYTSVVAVDVFVLCVVHWSCYREVV